MAKRILHLSSGKIWGGVETMLVNLAKASSTKPDYATFFNGELNRRLEGTGAKLTLLSPVRLSNPFSLWSVRKKLQRLLSDEKYDLVVAHGLWTHVVLSLALFRDPYVNHVVFLHDNIDPNSKLALLTKRFFPVSYLTNSRFLADEAKAFFGTPAIGYAHCPVYRPNFQENETAIRKRIRASIGTPQDRTVILQVSRLEPIKGHELHLRALSEIAGKDWECWMVGNSSDKHQHRYEHHLRELARELGVAEKVRFLDGHVSISEIMASADIYCQPNTGPEAFGVTFIEALYAGLPVVTTKLGSTPEIFGEDYGVLTPPGDAPALAAALLMLFDPKQRESYSRKGPIHADKLCNPIQQANYLKFLLEGGNGDELGAKLGNVRKHFV